MAEQDPHERPDDPWLSVAEVAAELRVNPATVRLWISKGSLPAKRVGRRKLFIRRLDLDLMLERAQREDPPGGFLPPLPGGTEISRPPARSRDQLRGSAELHGRQAEPGETEQIISRIQQADEMWSRAQAASENAPPDLQFPDRLIALAKACEEQEDWLLVAAQTRGFEWTPLTNRRGMVISYELRPGGNRPGPAELWDEFDRAVQRLAIAQEGAEMYGVAWAYRGLGEALHAIADALIAAEVAGQD